jgi:hypothetical protein
VAEPSILNSAQKLLADLSRGLEGEIERLKALMGDETGGTDFGKLMKAIQMNQKALLTVLDQRVKLEDAESGRPGREVIDLAEARDEISRRLARLGDQDKTGGVP